jgi:hypothetical protein
VRIPQGKTIAPDGGGLERECPACGERIELEPVISDVYEIIDEASGVPRSVYLPVGSDPPEGTHGLSLHTSEPMAPARRGQHTDYDDAAYRAHYEEMHA